MKSLLDENIYITNNDSYFPLNFAEKQAKKDLKKFKENLINSFNGPDLDKDVVNEVLNSKVSKSIFDKNLEKIFD